MEDVGVSGRQEVDRFSPKRRGKEGGEMEEWDLVEEFFYQIQGPYEENSEGEEEN